MTIDQAQFESALKRLFAHARDDTGGSRVAAQFLLSLWNDFNFRTGLQELLYCDWQMHDDIVCVFTTLYHTNEQLDTFVSQEQMDPIISQWGKAFKKK